MGTVAMTAAAYAVALGETAATSPGPVAVVAVTVVLLLLLAAVFWSFLRRARREGVAPLAVDRRTAPAQPMAPTGPATASVGGAARAEDAETEAAIADEIAEGGPVVDPEERS